MIIKNEENNEIKTAKTLASNMKWELSDREKGNFVQINKEITFLKGDDGNFLTTLPERGLFFSIHCLQGLNWDFNIEGLATLCNSSPETVNKYLKKLIKLGYIEKIDNRNKKGQFEKSTYIIHDSIIKENCIEQDYLNKHFPLKEKPNTEKPCSENSVLYNNKNIKELNDSKIKELKTKEDIYQPLSKFPSKDIHTSISDQSNIMLANKPDSIDNMNLQNKLKNKRNKKSSVENLKGIFFPQIEEIEDAELRELLIQFFTILIEERKKLHQYQFNALLNKLEELSKNDIYTKRFIVRKAIQHSWLNFYPVNDEEIRKICNKKQEIRNHEMNYQNFGPQFDENGKILEF